MTTTSRPTSLQALLLVPGLMCDAAVWAPLLPALAPHAQCHIVDHGMADNLGTMAEQLLGECLRRIELRQNLGSSWETASPRTTSATHFLNRPIQSGFNRRGGCVNVLSIQTQACF